MRESGFVSVVLIVIVLIVAVGAILFSQNGAATLDPPKVDDSILSQEVNLDTEAKKATYHFDIATLNNYKYEFEWEAYTSKSDDENVLEAIYDFNVDSPVRIVKSNLTTNQKSTVTENVMKLQSADTMPDLIVLTQPSNTNKIYISQGIEGTDGRGARLINFETGQLIEFYPLLEERRNCYDVPFKDKNQRSIIFSCEYDLPKDTPSGVTKSNEKLFSYSLVTEKRTELGSLNPGESFICDFGYSSKAKATYVATNQVKLQICKPSGEVLRSKTYSF